MITSALFSPLGDWIALACQNLGQLVVWEWQSQTYVLKQQGHFNNMTQLAYSPDGMHIASGGDDGKVCSYIASKKKRIFENLQSRLNYGIHQMVFVL
jgi:WD40 repeat protein